MARRELGPAALRVARAVRAALPGDAVVGCSGGADSLALALGAHWAAQKLGATVRAVVVDHGLQAGSDEVAARVVEELTGRGMPAESVRVQVHTADGGLEAAAREARLSALASYGVPVLLGHTLDDQAETVLLGLLRGSGTRALAGMSLDTPREVSSSGVGPSGSRGTRDAASSEDPSPECGAGHPAAPEDPSSRAVYRGTRLIRPLLSLRRADTVQACADWGVTPWHDPMNDDPRFARVAIRHHLAHLTEALGRDLAPALSRTADLARADADLLDELAADAVPTGADLAVDDVAHLPDALRWRVLHTWLSRVSAGVEYRHVLAVDALLTQWRGQGPIAIPGAQIRRHSGVLTHSAP